MSSYDLVIGLPSLNEESSIQNVLRMLDSSANLYYPDLKILFLNIDSNSTDNTIKLFLETTTKNDKQSIKEEKAGKGYNLIELCNFADKNNIPLLATFDTDIESMESDWLYKLVEPIRLKQADYTVPVYCRNRYEANTTNHFCYPLLSAILDTPIRQPIAGDFSLNINLARYILSQKTTPSVYKYGIDIFFTLSAIKGDFDIKEVYLGKKIHKPSFPKMVDMFAQVASSMLFMMRQINGYKGNFYKESQQNRESVSKDFIKSPSKEDIKKRKETALSLLGKNNFYSLNTEIIKKYNDQNKITIKDWSDYLYKVYNFTLDNEDIEIEKIGQEITPIYLLRVLSYFDEIEIDSFDIENIFTETSMYIKNLKS